MVMLILLVSVDAYISQALNSLGINNRPSKSILTKFNSANIFCEVH